MKPAFTPLLFILKRMLTTVVSTLLLMLVQPYSATAGSASVSAVVGPTSIIITGNAEYTDDPLKSVHRRLLKVYIRVYHPLGITSDTTITASTPRATLSQGPYTASAYVWDDYNGYAARSTFVIDNTPQLTLSMTSPIRGGPTAAGGTVTFVGGLAPNNFAYGNVRCELFNSNGQYVWGKSVNPDVETSSLSSFCVIPTHLQPSGNYTLRARAYALNNALNETSQGIVIDNMPQVSWEEPVDGNLYPGNIPITGNVVFTKGANTYGNGHVRLEVTNSNGSYIWGKSSYSPTVNFDLSQFGAIPSTSWADGTYTATLTATAANNTDKMVFSRTLIISKQPVIQIVPDPGPYRYGDPVKGLIRVSAPVDYPYSGSVTIRLAGLTTSVSVDGLGDYPFSFSLDQLEPGSYELTADGVLSGFNVSDGPANVTVELVAKDEVLGGKDACKTCECKSVQVTGNPIQIATGDKLHAETDFSIGKLNFKRHYHSQSTFDGHIGYGWSFSYGWVLASTNAQELTVRRDDGKLIRFANDGTGLYKRQFELTHEQVVATANGWLYKRDDNSSVEFDASGKLVALRNEDGRSTTVSYDGSGNLNSITDQFGRQAAITTDASGHITSVSGPAGRIWSYTYDASYNLTSVVYPDGTSRRYLYADPNDVHNLTTIVDEVGRIYANYVYDAQDRAILSEHPLTGQSHSVVYNADNTVNVTEADGTTRTYVVDIVDGIPTVTAVSNSNCNCGAATNFTFDSATGFLSSSTDKLGNSMNYTYNAEGRVLTKTEAVGASVERTTIYAYDGAGHLTSLTDGLGNITSYTYDAEGRMLTTTDPLGKTKTNIWNADGTLASVTDVSGNSTAYAYNGFGQVAVITNPDLSTRSMVYDIAGRIVSVTDELGSTTTYNYDLQDRVTSISYPDGTSISNTYDVAGDLVRTTDAAGLITTYTYDVEHRPLTMTRPDGSTVNSTFDAKGNLTARDVRDAAGVPAISEAMGYNADGRLTSTTHADATSTSNTYDALGRLLTSTDEAGKTSTYSYDALGRLVAASNGKGEIATYAYDAADHLIRATAANGVTTTFTFDAAGRLIQEASSDRSLTNYTYNNVGDLVSKTDGNGTVSNYGYDTRHRMTSISYPADPSRNVSFTYDAAGHLSGMTDIAGSTAYTHDVVGRVTSASWSPAGSSLTLTVAYTYDSAGRPATITYPTGRTLTYNYDGAGRIGSVDATVNGSATNLVSTLTYDALGNITSRTLGNGIVETRSIDSRGRVVTIDAAGVMRRTLTWSADSMISAIADGMNPAASQSFTYDPANRLISAAGGYGNISYAYDANGNRLSRSDATGTVSSAYQAATNRLAGAGSRLFTRDGAGNRLSDGALNYSYAVNNRLVAVSDNTGAPVAGYLHNGKGERVAKTVNGATTWFVYDLSGNLIGEYGATGVMLAEHLYGPSGRVVTVRAMQPTGGAL